ncbi:MAG: hypothetical protein ABI181_09695 [Mycobacteriaceae bacterium]
MIAIITVLLAFPIGLVLRSRRAALLTYAVVYLWAFVFQTTYLLLDAMDGGRDAFTPGEFPGPYGLVTGVIFAVGLGLVVLGHRVGSRRRQTIAASTASTASR